MKNLLLRLIANRTGVIEDQVRILFRFHLPVSLLHQGANDLFRVMHIHLAAKGFQVEGFGARRHFFFLQGIHDLRFRHHSL
jgi:hypothetical protein